MSNTPIKNANYHKKILVIEDDTINQAIIKTMLTKLNLQVTIADNGKIGFEIFQQDSFNIIFMDIQMPEMDGLEATRLIRQHEQDHQIKQSTPIVAVTAHALQSEQEKCFDAGVDEFVSKPIKMDTIRHVLNKWLD